MAKRRASKKSECPVEIIFADAGMSSGYRGVGYGAVADKASVEAFIASPPDDLQALLRVGRGVVVYEPDGLPCALGLKPAPSRQWCWCGPNGRMQGEEKPFGHLDPPEGTSYHAYENFNGFRGIGLNWELWWEKVRQSDWLISVSYLLGVDRRRVVLALKPAIERAVQRLRSSLDDATEQYIVNADDMVAGIEGAQQALLEWATSSEKIAWKPSYSTALQQIDGFYGHYEARARAARGLWYMMQMATDDPVTLDMGGLDPISTILTDFANLGPQNETTEKLVGLAHARRSIRLIDLNLALAVQQMQRVSGDDD